jgi:hypothetical protein
MSESAKFSIVRKLDKHQDETVALRVEDPKDGQIYDYHHGEHTDESEAKIDVVQETGTNVPVSGQATIEGSVSIQFGKELNALYAFNQVGLVARDANSQYFGRTIEVSDQLTITNANAVAGNPTLGLKSLRLNQISDFKADYANKVVYGDGTMKDLVLPDLPDNIATITDVANSLITSKGYTDNRFNNLPSNIATTANVSQAITSANTYTNAKFVQANAYTDTAISNLDFATEAYVNTQKTSAINTSSTYTNQQVDSAKQFATNRTLLASKISGYPSNANYVLKGNGMWGSINSFSSAINMNSNRINNVATPYYSNDATNKSFVENLVNNKAYDVTDMSGFSGNYQHVLHGDKNWGLVKYTDFTQSMSAYNIYINNMYTSATETGLDIRENTYSRFKIGYNARDNYAYIKAAQGSESVKHFIHTYLSYEVYPDGIRLHNNRIMESKDPALLQDLANKRYVDNKFSSVSSSSSSTRDERLNWQSIPLHNGAVNWLRRSYMALTLTKIYGLDANSFILENKLGESAGIGFSGNEDAVTAWCAGDRKHLFNFQDEDNSNSRASYINDYGSLVVVSSKLNKTSIRTKANNNVLDRFMKLDVKSYGLKYDGERKNKYGFVCPKRTKRVAEKEDAMRIGLVLEEVFKVFPNCVSDYTNKLSVKRDKDIKIEDHVKDIKNSGIDYNSLLCYFIIAFQEFVHKYERTIKE